MTIEEYREKVNPCYGRACYDPDLGCMMPAEDLWYACPLEPDLSAEEWKEIYRKGRVE